ncbi:hypothetical protein SDJN02_25088, partial [Cucurbita argyrosperma subsp. argyrosperma]
MLYRKEKIPIHYEGTQLHPQELKPYPSSHFQRVISINSVNYMKQMREKEQRTFEYKIKKLKFLHVWSHGQLISKNTSEMAEGKRSVIGSLPGMRMRRKR